MKLKFFTLLFSFTILLGAVRADEGMLIPLLIKAFESDMQARGMKLTADQIYSVNHASLKDAIFQFGGGCTAELVSSQGLLLTNHHCGYSQIQSHSSLEHDYLKNGFWAKEKKDELTNPGLTATRIVRIEDVTALVLQNAQGKQDKSVIAANIATIVKTAIEGTHYEAEVKAFDYGNAYYLMVKEVFKDIRLLLLIQLENLAGIQITGFGRDIPVIFRFLEFMPGRIINPPPIQRIMYHIRQFSI